MAVYNVKVDLYVDGATQNDAWAQGLVENVVQYTKALGGQAAVTVGSAGERSSYAVSGVIDGVTSELVVELAWHVNDIGVVTDGLPDGSGGPPPPVGEWAAGTTYAIDDTVSYLGVTYRCLQGHPSQVGWEPPNVPALWVAI
jgi:hypothetical protein